MRVVQTVMITCLTLLHVQAATAQQQTDDRVLNEPLARNWSSYAYNEAMQRQRLAAVSLRVPAAVATASPSISSPFPPDGLSVASTENLNSPHHQWAITH